MLIEKYHINEWNEPETGVFIDENEEWVLIKSIPVDFQIDGFKLINKKHLEERTLSSESEILKRVFELKNESIEKPFLFEFKSLIEMLRWVEKTYGCFEFQDDLEDELFYGVLSTVSKESFYIDMIKFDGSTDEDFDVEFFNEDIRVITFDSNYFNAISLLFKDKRK